MMSSAKKIINTSYAISSLTGTLFTYPSATALNNAYLQMMN